jgi:uncharacterized membrane protein YeaQ/YmgE (transglycosylase-associated protein family)/uncharacterized protein YjbJ (UPF0337 family)
MHLSEKTQTGEVEMVNVFVWLIAGAVIGGLATLIMHRRHSILLLSIIVGSVGAFLAGYWLSPMFGLKTTSFSWPGLLVSLVGTIVLLVIFNYLVVREHNVTNKVMESQWNKVREKVHVRWGKISEADCDQINGDHDRLINMLAERYGIAKKEAEDQLQSYLGAVTTRVPWLSFLHKRPKDVVVDPVHGHSG